MLQILQLICLDELKRKFIEDSFRHKKLIELLKGHLHTFAIVFLCISLGFRGAFNAKDLPTFFKITDFVTHFHVNGKKEYMYMQMGFCSSSTWDIFMGLSL